MFRDIDKKIMRKFLFLKVYFCKFLSEFSIFLNTDFSADIPINRIYYINNSVPSVASRLIKAKMGQTRKEVKMRNLLLDYLRYRSL